jgi:hypothetical protein
MDGQLRQDFYRHIDKNGIDGEWMGGMEIKIDPHQDKSLPAFKMMDDFFQPFMFEFKLSESEKVSLIKDYFKDTYKIHIDKLSELVKLKTLNGKLFLYQFCENNRCVFKIVKQHLEHPLYLRNISGVKNLGIIEEINGGLFLSNSTLESISPLKHLQGDFWHSGYTKEFLQDIGSLEAVTGNLNLSKTKITSLGNLKKVGGNLNLRSTKITDLSNLAEIGGNLLLNKDIKKHYIFDPTIVKGTIKYFNK